LVAALDCAHDKGNHDRLTHRLAALEPCKGSIGPIREPTIPDKVLDRIVHNAYRIDLKGKSQRKHNRPPPLDGGNDK